MTIVAFMTDAPRLLSDREIACVGGGTLGGGGIGPAPSPNFGPRPEPFDVRYSRLLWSIMAWPY
jgi:hypothetical protein